MRKKHFRVSFLSQKFLLFLVAFKLIFAPFFDGLSRWIFSIRVRSRESSNHFKTDAKNGRNGNDEENLLDKIYDM